MDEIEQPYGDAAHHQLDGISIDYDDWHFNVRASNTEPLLRLCLESLVSQRGHGAPSRRGARPHPVMTGIHCLPVPTPFAVGRVNCYLIDDDPLTLVDTGPNSGKALDQLERALREHGRRIEDLERIIITHQHLDHLGLVGILADRSGAEVVTLDVLAPVVEEFGAHAERDDELAEALMLRHGIPRDVVTALRSVSRSFRAWGGSAKVGRRLADGEDAAVRRPHAAGAAPPGPLAVGHAVLGRGERRADRR